MTIEVEEEYDLDIILDLYNDEEDLNVKEVEDGALSCETEESDADEGDNQGTKADPLQVGIGKSKKRHYGQVETKNSLYRKFTMFCSTSGQEISKKFKSYSRKFKVQYKRGSDQVKVKTVDYSESSKKSLEGSSSEITTNYKHPSQARVKKTDGEHKKDNKKGWGHMVNRTERYFHMSHWRKAKEPSIQPLQTPIERVKLSPNLFREDASSFYNDEPTSEEETEKTKQHETLHTHQRMVESYRRLVVTPQPRIRPIQHYGFI